MPPLRFRIQLDTTSLCDRVVPWGESVTLSTPLVDVKLPARYTPTFSVEWTELPRARRPPIPFLSEIANEAP